MSLTVKLQAPYLSLDLIAGAIAAAEVSRAIPPTLREQRQALRQSADDWRIRLPKLLKASKATPRLLDDFAAVPWKQWEPDNHVFHIGDLNACAGLSDAGFTFEVAEDTKQTLENVAHIGEFAFNGRLIDWDDWLRQMPDLSVIEATRLMCGLDPELYEDLSWRPAKNDPSWLCARAAKMERQALAAGIERKTAADWLRWAQGKGFQVHQAFTMAVQELPTAAELDDELKRLPSEEAAHWNTAHLYPRREGVREVTWTYCDGLASSTQTMTLGEFLWWTADRLDRWRLGEYTVIEAAQVIADAHANTSARKLYEQMEDAMRGGSVVLRRNGIAVPLEEVQRKVPLWAETVREQDVNEWLIEVRSHLRLTYPYAAELATPKESRHKPHEWKETAAELARAIIERERTNDRYPSQENIGDEVARDMRKRQIFGPSGKPLTGAYIKRHVLGPLKISSAEYRQLSMAPRRGK